MIVEFKTEEYLKLPLVKMVCVCVNLDPLLVVQVARGPQALERCHQP